MCVCVCDSLKISFSKRFLVTSVSGVQILYNPRVRHSLNILPTIKMSNRNIAHRVTQTTGMGALSASATLIANIEYLVVTLRMLAVLFQVHKRQPETSLQNTE